MDAGLAKLAFCKFFLLMGADRIEVTECSHQRVCGTVGWPDQGQPHYDPADEVDEAAWSIPEQCPLAEISLLMEVLLTRQLTKLDRIIVTPEQLASLVQQDLGWADQRTLAALQNFLSVEIANSDREYPGDSFFFEMGRLASQAAP